METINLFKQVWKGFTLTGVTLAVLLLATEEEKQKTDYSKSSARLIEHLAA